MLSVNINIHGFVLISKIFLISNVNRIRIKNMILAIDVHYEEQKGYVAGVYFDEWSVGQPLKTYSSVVNDIAEYESGEFYKRELPCILALLGEHEIMPEIIVIDGYVTLGANDKPGLGQHLYEALESKVIVVGVAKNGFLDNSECEEVYRGESKKPLYITSAGISVVQAKKYISSMHGAYREPTLLKMADRLCRDLAKASI